MKQHNNSHYIKSTKHLYCKNHANYKTIRWIARTVSCISFYPHDLLWKSCYVFVSL